MGTPLVIEVAINGFITKDENPNVPLTPGEMAGDIRACLDAGAAIIHVHAGDRNFGKVQRHASKPYFEVFKEILNVTPEALMYPTLPAGPHLPVDERYMHIRELYEAGVLRIVPVDPGTMNWGPFVATAGTEDESVIRQNTFADVRYAFEYCILHNLGCTMSIFEPGFLQLEPILIMLRRSLRRRSSLRTRPA